MSGTQRAVGAALCASLLLATLVVLASSPSSPQPNELSSKSFLDAATSAAQTAQMMRRKAEMSENKIQDDELKISSDMTQLHRYERELHQDEKRVSGSMRFNSDTGDKKVQDLLVKSQQLQQRIKDDTPRITKAKHRVEREKTRVASDRLEIKQAKEKRADLLSAASILQQKAELAEKRVKSLKARSNRDFKIATTPGKVGWNYYADHGATLMNEEKLAKQKAHHLASMADSDRIDASLVGGVNGNADILAQLKRDKQELKFAQKQYDRDITARGALMERLAAAKTRLAAAQMESQSLHKDATIASSAAQSIQSHDTKLKSEIRKIKDQIDELQTDVKSNAHLKQIFARRAQSEDSISQTQFKEMEQE